MNMERTDAMDGHPEIGAPVVPPAVDPREGAGSAGAVAWHMPEVWIAAVIVALDQLAKAVVRATIPLHDSVTVIHNMVSFTHVRNPGAAFGILSGADFPFKTPVIALVATSALVAIGVYGARLSAHERVARLGLALILGGAAGNLIDRFLVGYVLDFVDVYWRDYHFWAFNVADSAITIGVTVMLADMIGLGPHVSKTV